MDIAYLQLMLNLEGKNAIVTGGNQGIGKGIACSLVKFGARVTILGRNKRTLEETCLKLRKSGSADFYVVDVSDRAAVAAFFKAYMLTHTTLDIFVNNAGYSVHAPLEDTEEKDIDGLIDTNLKGSLCCLQHAGNIMKRQHKGSIVIITSINGLNAHPTQGMYSVTKFALQGAMKALASTLGEYGVRVNSCAPGAIDTPINAAAFSVPGCKESVEKRITLRRIGTIEEIGDAVACIASDAFRYMTGATVVIDGGMMLKQK
jgi:NAD(P)-dependent dehydrogenase (short-subunit alcohol dehydrogenase family)